VNSEKRTANDHDKLGAAAISGCMTPEYEDEDWRLFRRLKGFSLSIANLFADDLESTQQALC